MAANSEVYAYGNFHTQRREGYEMPSLPRENNFRGRMYDRIGGGQEPAEEIPRSPPPAPPISTIPPPPTQPDETAPNIPSTRPMSLAYGYGVPLQRTPSMIRDEAPSSVSASARSFPAPTNSPPNAPNRTDGIRLANDTPKDPNDAFKGLDIKYRMVGLICMTGLILIGLALVTFAAVDVLATESKV